MLVLETGLKREEYSRAVGMLAGSAALAHGITAAALPVLSRLYSPSDFSTLAVFASVLSLFAVIAALRFDIAIPIPEEDDDAFNLLVMSIGLAAVFSLALALVTLNSASWIAAHLDQPRVERYLLMLPLGVLLASSSSALQSWFVRKKGFSILARSRLVQSSLSAGTQVGLGLLSVAPLGLVIGHVMNSGVACAALGARVVRERRDNFSETISWRRMRRVLSAYSRFPKYSTFEALCNSGSIHLPIILVAALAAGPEAGYLTLAMTLMQAPMSLIGLAIGQVFLSRAPDEHRAGRLPSLTTDTLSHLLKTGIGPLIAAGIVSPFAFSLVFGPEWQRAGLLVSWMTPWFVLQFLVVPIAMALHVTGHQKHALLLQVLGLAVRVMAVIAAATWASDKIGEAYAVSGMVFYLAYMLLVLSVTKVSAAQLFRSAVGSFPYVAGWAALGVAIVYGLSLVMAQNQ